MLQDPSFYRDRAAWERNAAAETSLARVKERHLHAAESWDRMAERGEAHLEAKARRLASEAHRAENSRDEKEAPSGR